MKTSAKRLLGAVAALAVVAALAWWQRGPLTVALMERQVLAQTASADPLAALADGLHVGLCGAGSPFPDDLRSGPCTVVVAGRRMFVFDAGSGAGRNVARMRLNAGQIEALFLTHYHSDHIDGLGELMLQRWVQGTHRAPLPVHGPPGLEAVLQGFVTAYTLDQGYRTAHHGAAVVPRRCSRCRPTAGDACCCQGLTWRSWPLRSSTRQSARRWATASATRTVAW